MVAMPPKMTLTPFLPVEISNLPAPLHLHGQHHGDPDHIDRLIKINGLQIFIHKINIDIIGQGGGKDNRPMRRQVKLGLPVQLGPLGIDELKFHNLSALIKVIVKVYSLRPEALSSRFAGIIRPALASGEPALTVRISCRAES